LDVFIKYVHLNSPSQIHRCQDEEDSFIKAFLSLDDSNTKLAYTIKITIYKNPETRRKISSKGRIIFILVLEIS
jgi:hypothetical protein